MKNWDWKSRLAEYFTFTLNERWAVLILVLIMLVLLIIPRFFQSPAAAIIIEDSLVRKAMAKIDTANLERPHKSYPDFKRREIKESRGERFYFDPNTITAEGWMRLGIKEKTALTICKYREKGGKFRSAADLEKIYGLPPDLVRLLKPFVRIVAPEIISKNNFHYPAKKTPSRVNINRSDSLEWEALPGIGARLASRIINFRNRLGGFYAISQVAEVYGLQDSVFKKIEPFLQADDHPLLLIPINSATMDELARHPYIRRPIANAIVQYRVVHGRFQQLEDLKKIHLVGPDEYAEISRYCRLE